MTASPDPGELTDAHRATLDHIEKHATTHNLAWDDVLGLLRQIADVSPAGGDRIKVELGGHHVFVSKPKHDAVDEQTVLSLRDLFKDAGYTSSKD